MSTSKAIYFFASKDSKMIRFINKSLREIYKSTKPKRRYNWSSHVNFLIEGKGSSLSCLSVESTNIWIFRGQGQDASYFGGEDVCSSLEKNILLHSYLTLGSNGTEQVGNKRFQYPVVVFEQLMEKIYESNLENDVYVLFCSDNGGEIKRTNPRCKKIWNGKFV